MVQKSRKRFHVIGKFNKKKKIQSHKNKVHVNHGHNVFQYP